MAVLSRSAIIAAPAERVFAYADDIRNLARRMSQNRSMPMMGSTLKLDIVTPAVTGVGATYRYSGRMMGLTIDFSETVTQYEPGRRKVWHTIGTPRLLIIAGYEMAVLVEPILVESARLTIGIDYTLPRAGAWRTMGGCSQAPTAAGASTAWWKAPSATPSGVPQHEQRHHHRLAASVAEVSHHFRRIPPHMGICATAALHHLGDGNAEREPVCLRPLHGRRRRHCWSVAAGQSRCAGLTRLAGIEPSQGLSRYDCHWRRLHDLQRMAEYDRPSELGLFGVDAGAACHGYRIVAPHAVDRRRRWRSSLP
jgi:hypothetical protein